MGVFDNKVVIWSGSGIFAAEYERITFGLFLNNCQSQELSIFRAEKYAI